MCKLFSQFEDEIKAYCAANNLDFETLRLLPQCWGKNDIWIQFYDREKGKNGLKDEAPAPVVLKITIHNGKASFEQTEHTAKYLGKAS